jgi:uncharacterized protein YchJ
MQVTTGKLVNIDDIVESEKKNYVLVNRDLTAKEKADKQIRLYSPCGCGSGKKFKFCCFRQGEQKKGGEG